MASPRPTSAAVSSGSMAPAVADDLSSRNPRSCCSLTLTSGLPFAVRHPRHAVAGRPSPLPGTPAGSDAAPRAGSWKSRSASCLSGARAERTGYGHHALTEKGRGLDLREVAAGADLGSVFAGADPAHEGDAGVRAGGVLFEDSNQIRSSASHSEALKVLLLSCHLTYRPLGMSSASGLSALGR